MHYGRNRKAVDDWTYGNLIVRGQTCPFLNEGNLCDIHARFWAWQAGLDLQGLPRAPLILVNGQAEQTMSLSCPEAARLCLLHPDSTQVVEVHPKDLLENMSGRMSIQEDESGLDSYIQFRGDVRQAMQLLFDARQYDTNGRLYLLVYFAFRINDFYHEKNN